MNYKDLKEAYPELYSDLNPEDKGPKYSMVHYGFETPKGWLNLLERMSKEVSEIVLRKGLVHFRFDQIKTKFGSLCLYPNYNHSRDELKEINVILDKYEEEANKTCEFCGSQEHVERINTGWIYNLCKACAKEKRK